MSTTTITATASPAPEDEFAAIIRAGFTTAPPHERMPTCPQEAVHIDPHLEAIAARFKA